MDNCNFVSKKFLATNFTNLKKRKLVAKKLWFFNLFCGMPSEMANNDRKQIPRFVAPRCGAICYVIYFLSLFTSYGGIPQKSSKNQIYLITSSKGVPVQALGNGILKIAEIVGAISEIFILR